MKKILSLVLAMLMIFSMVPAVFAAETSESDYQAAIEYLKALELYKGTTDGDAADELVERYQMALFTARMVTGRVDKAYWETDANDSGFTDIDELNAEALGGVCYAAQQGIVNGIGGSEFAPFDNVTYRDAIVMIVRALGFNYPASGYPWSYINKARELGVLDGITGVSYTAEVKREVIAQLLYNAINAEIKGESIAANVFGVEETIVMVTASYDLVYGAGASKALKNTMVKVSAIDADGEPIGTEYYVPYSTLGAKTPAQANALVGTYFKLTHKGNFAEFLAVESLTKVFENTPDKKEVNYTYTSGALTLGGESYLAISGDYSAVLNNAQGTVNGAKEVKFFKAFGAEGVKTGTADYVLAADGNIYAKNNPFTPYAIYSDLVDAWFKVVTAVVTEEIPGVTDDPATEEDETENRFFVTTEVIGYERLSAKEVQDLLAKTTERVMGFTRLQANVNADYTYFSAKYPYNGNPTPYDYYKAIASDIDGDGDYDRVTARPYELLRINKWNETRKIDGTSSTVAFFTAESYTVAENQGGFADSKILYGKEVYTGTSYDTLKDEDVDLYRFTGIKLDKVPNEAFVIAYISREGVGAEKEIDIVEVIGGAQKDADDNAYVFQTYIRGYDSVTNKVIYGANYDTMYIGTWAVKNTALYDAPGAPSSMRATYTAATAKYVQNFWNKYVNVYVLNGAIIHIELVDDSNDFVILESFTDFTEDGLKAMAYSTKDGGYAEVTIGELNGWSLGGYDYELFMLLKQMTDLGLTVKDYKLPIFLNKIYAVRSVDENGAYNLVEPVALNEGNPASIYVNNFGYILGVKSNGTLDAGSRVATSDKDLWIIQTQKTVDGKTVADKVVMFKGKLSAIELVGFKWYKVADNQYVAVAPVGYNLGPILGNTSEGLDYWMYNRYINNYKNETLYNGFYYGHYMTNVRTGAVEFVTYDSKLAKDLFLGGNTNYIVLEEGGIYPATNKVLKDATYPDATNGLTQIRVNTASMKAVADLQYVSAKYHAYEAAAVGAVIPVGVNAAQAVAAGIFTSDIKVAVNNYADLRDAIAANLHYGVYGNDFINENTNTDVYAQIKKELLANVTFIHRTAAGTYESWVGYKSSNNTWPTPAAALGTSTQFAKAYVLYDYANASAKVFIDSMSLVTPNDAIANSTKTLTDAVLGDVTVAMTTNFLANKTSVRVNYATGVDAYVSNVAIAGFTVSNLVSHKNFATFDVAATDYEAIKAATWTITAQSLSLTGLAKVNGVKVSDDTFALPAIECTEAGAFHATCNHGDTSNTDAFVGCVIAAGYKPAENLFNGVLSAATWTDELIQVNGPSLYHHYSYETLGLVSHISNPDDRDVTLGFNYGFITELPADTDSVKRVRIYQAVNPSDAAPFARGVLGVAVMASADGKDWTLLNDPTVKSYELLDGVWTNYDWTVVPATADKCAYMYTDVVIDADADTKYIALGYVGYNGFGKNNSIYWNMTELEFYTEAELT